MPRTYEKHPLSKDPGSEDFVIVEIRPGHRNRVVNPRHHTYEKFIAKGGEPTLMEFRPRPKAPKIGRVEARAQAVAEHLYEYSQAMARWTAFGETTKSKALKDWKAKVEARAAEIEEG